MSKHICTSFGNPQFQYCLDCDQLLECFDERDRITLENMSRDILGESVTVVSKQSEVEI